MACWFDLVDRMKNKETLEGLVCSDSSTGSQALPPRNRDQKDDRMGWETYECFKEKEIAYGL